jgi:hypothetical protein
MKWQCTYHNSHGVRCENEALHRIHFSSEHPFNHVDVCALHYEEYQIFCWVEDLHLKDGRENVQ